LKLFQDENSNNKMPRLYRM